MSEPSREGPAAASERFADLRFEYELSTLRRRDLAPAPMDQLQRWFDAAVEAGLAEPNLMILATATREGWPSARALLMKGISAQSIDFYTNRQSRKGRELAANDRAAATLYWLPLQRQVRIEGRVEPLSDATSDAYFSQRPRDSQLGAWASPQSKVIADRAELEARFKAVEAEHAGQDEIPRPPDWGGYRLLPDYVEFWQGRPNRLHDRFCYRRHTDVLEVTWAIERLAP